MGCLDEDAPRLLIQPGGNCGVWPTQWIYLKQDTNYGLADEDDMRSDHGIFWFAKHGSGSENQSIPQRRVRESQMDARTCTFFLVNLCVSTLVHYWLHVVHCFWAHMNTYHLDPPWRTSPEITYRVRAMKILKWLSLFYIISLVFV